ncbi:E3 ubiquitin-protein ligase TRIM21-like [Xiphophorus hellerii]|uniref:E3 ubiquitin-protein ligase TRIM21-like n=1 Tax=Xiphophorus hellerii TaxID=8084 RepID=UPI0013B43EFE|nr:E3 ubiquitin-protein ligase TRIM21-like [Xiphophorus hellerii]
MAASGQLTEDQLRCQICKNIFTFPVTLPCGDNLCKTCILREWGQSVHCQCPICEKEFNERPQLQPNQNLSKMANCLKKSKAKELCTINKSETDISPYTRDTSAHDSSNRIGESNFHSKLNNILSRSSSNISSGFPRRNTWSNNSSNVSIPTPRKHDTNTNRESNFHSNLSSTLSRSSSVIESNTSRSNNATSNSSNSNISLAATNTTRSLSLAVDENNFNSTPSQQRVATLGDISCDECTGLKLKAVKSCLVCLASYCETHLKPHLMTKGLKKHQLLEPVENLEARMCSYHNKPLELFCRTDQTFTCMLCTLLDHKEHDYLPLSEEAGQKRSVLRGTEETLNRMIQERRGKMQDLRYTSRLNQEAADGKAAVGLQVFTDLKRILENGSDELLRNIEIRQVTAERLTERLIAELGQEVKVLMQSSADVQELSSSDDHAHVLRSFSSVNNIPAMKDWSDISVQIPLYEEMVRKAVVEAVDQLQATFKKEEGKLKEAELKRVQKFKVNLTLDTQTADPWLIVSDDGKQVRLGDFKKFVPDLPKRFNPGGGVVAQQNFGFGRFYFEVQVMDMMKYDFGVVYESINRKKKITNSKESGHWILSLRKENEYKARASHEIPLSLTHRPQRIGLFVDYDEGLVSFYDVGIAEHIFSFNDCSFTERLYPFFNPGHGSRNSASLKIGQ